MTNAYLFGAITDVVILCGIEARMELAQIQMTFFVIVTQRIDDIWHLEETRSEENNKFNNRIRYNDVNSPE